MSFDLRTNQRMYAYTPYETRVQPTISEIDEIQQQDDASTTPNFFPGVFKGLLGQWFGEYISNLFLRRNILQLDLFFQALVP